MIDPKKETHLTDTVFKHICFICDMFKLTPSKEEFADMYMNTYAMVAGENSNPVELYVCAVHHKDLLKELKLFPDNVSVENTANRVENAMVLYERVQKYCSNNKIPSKSQVVINSYEEIFKYEDAPISETIH